MRDVPLRQQLLAGDDGRISTGKQGNHMARYVEILFRHWVRFAVILVLMPVPVSIATLLYFRTVQSTTNLWVEEPTYLGADISSNNVAGWNQYLTPSQNETDELAQYLQTDSF